ncbi:MAG: hypothetical protein GXY91_04430 [Clostridia bacterium]|nr:hypothetical protein [Clostridia bacterium]
MQVPLIALIIQGIPEEISLVTLAFVIAKADLDWKKIILGGTFLAFSMYVIRLLPISFGVHTIVLILLLIVFIKLLGQVQDLSIAIMAGLISMLALSTTEILILTALTSILEISEQEFVNNVTLRLLLTLPQVFVMFILAFVIYKVRKN